MDKALFEQLLYEGESPTLDFKMEQYRFAKASDHEKSELLKDILGFANAWRNSKAYIIIGVEDIEGERGNPVGIPASDHIDDHSLQQFVNNLTNQPVLFHYEAFGFEEKQFGIICIEQQLRPIYLKKDYGKLKKNEVYVRRGSSTDPGKPALPEEIAQMRADSSQVAPELIVEFAHFKRNDAIGTKISLEAQKKQWSNAENITKIPDQLFRLDGKKKAFELIEYEYKQGLFRPIRLVIKNTGKVVAQNTRVEIKIQRKPHMEIKDCMPNNPKYSTNLLKNIDSERTGSRGNLNKFDIIRKEDRFQIAFNSGDLQPSRQVYSDVFYIATTESENLSLDGSIFANNLPEEKKFALNVSVTVTVIELNKKDLIKIFDKNNLLRLRISDTIIENFLTK